MPPILSVRNLTKIYNSNAPLRAVDEVSFDLNEGEILGLLGPNGAGKTTTIRMLITTLIPSSGEITFFGKNLFKERSAILQNVGFASTYTNLPLFLTVSENLDVHGRIYGMDSAARKKRISELLDYFHLSHLSKKRITQLSAGQKTCMILIKAFIPCPKIVLLDEPTASLDPEIAIQVRKFLVFQRSENKVAMLFSSHNMEEITELCDRVVFLRNGKVLAIDTPENLASTYSSSTLILKICSGLTSVIEVLKSNSQQYETEGDIIKIHTSNIQTSALLEKIILSGGRFSKIEILHPTLENYFIKVARQ